EMAAEHLGAKAHAVRLVGEAQYGDGMRMVDIAVRQKGVQQGFDRYVRRCRIEESSARNAHHLCVIERLTAAQRAQRGEADRGQAFRLQRGEVPTAALDAQNFGRLTEYVWQHGFNRRVAAAMQNQARITAEEARAIDAQRHLASDT